MADAPNQPPRQTPEEIDATIDTASHVDEALLETFPASDPPGYTGGGATPSQDAENTPKPGDA
ncbi:MAG: hypothetical protein AAF809_04990 [Bacteroidota bacterium]